MSQQLQIIIQQMIVFIILLGIGVIAARTKVLTTTVLDGLAKIVVNITLPAMIITMIPGAATRDELIKAFPFLICSFFLILVLFGLGRFTAKLTGLTGNTADVHAAETTFGNVGFMGIPLIVALFGGQGIFNISVFSVADHSLLWTLGSFLTAKEEGANIKGNLKKIVNPTTVALMAALVLVGLGIRPQGVVVDTIKGLGDTTRFLSMVYIGGTLAHLNFRQTWRKPSIFLVIFLKMMVAPLIVFSLLSLVKDFLPGEGVMTLTLIAALPSMVTIAMMARANGSDDIYASECVFLTTISSIVTIPLISFIIGKMM